MNIVRRCLLSMILVAIVIINFPTVSLAAPQTFTNSGSRSDFPSSSTNWPSTGVAYGTRWTGIDVPPYLAYANIGNMKVDYDITTRYISYVYLKVLNEPYTTGKTIYNHSTSTVKSITGFDNARLSDNKTGSFSISSSHWRNVALYNFKIGVGGVHPDRLSSGARLYRSDWTITVNYDDTPVVTGSSSNSRTINLNFKAMADATSGTYKLYRDNVIIKEWNFNAMGSNLSYSDTNLNMATSYTYKLVDPKGRTSSNRTITTLAGTPGTPSVSNITQTTNTISGYHNANNPSTVNYDIYRKDVTANGNEIKIASNVGHSYNDSNLVPGRVYNYRIKAVQNNGYESGFSGTRTITMRPPTPSPTYVVGEGDWHNSEGRGKVVVSWPTTLNATGYKLWVNDGYQYRAYDVGNVTSWDSSVWKIYPSEVELDSYSNNTVTSNILNMVKGGLGLRDNPNKLYNKTSGTSKNAATHYEFRVSAYNGTGETPQSATVSVQLPNRTDQAPPVVGGIVLNDGLTRTGSTKINVDVSASDVVVPNHTATADDDYSGVDKIQISNDNFTTYQEFQWEGDPLSGEQSFEWSIPAGDGSKLVYVRAVDKAGNISLPQSTSVYLVDDTIAPIVNVSINDGAEYTTTPNVEVMINASDNLSTISQLNMRFSLDGKTWGGWESFAFLKNITFPDSTSGTKRVFVQVIDGAGNVTIASDDIKLMTEEEVLADKLITRAEKDVTPPTIESFSLINRASATRDTRPTIQLSAFDNTSEFYNMKVQFRTLTTGWSAPQMPDYVMTPNIILNNGPNTLFIRVMDESGNMTERSIMFFKL